MVYQKKYNQKEFTFSIILKTKTKKNLFFFFLQKFKVGKKYIDDMIMCDERSGMKICYGVITCKCKIWSKLH